MTKRPHDEIIGCDPAGESSTIERRRWPSAKQASASAKPSPSSGPRWRSVSVIASATAATAAGALFRRRSQMPATPHISADLVLSGHVIRIARAEHVAVGFRERRQRRRRRIWGAYDSLGFLT